MENSFAQIQALSSLLQQSREQNDENKKEGFETFPQQKQQPNQASISNFGPGMIGGGGSREPPLIEEIEDDCSVNHPVTFVMNEIQKEIKEIDELNKRDGEEVIGEDDSEVKDGEVIGKDDSEVKDGEVIGKDDSEVKDGEVIGKYDSEVKDVEEVIGEDDSGVKDGEVIGKDDSEVKDVEEVIGEDVSGVKDERSEPHYSCLPGEDELVIETILPETELKYISLHASETHVNIFSAKHKLILELPSRIDPRSSKAQWFKSKELLKITFSVIQGQKKVENDDTTIVSL